ncbi:ankyrin repeat-containing protein ITN1-like [Cocos nucifera]|nr:ankyrin repeat-containing protein ITN1-like [Cocos nucifera]
MDLALYVAVTQGNVQGLREMVEKDQKILQSSTPQGNTALHLVAKLGHRDLAEEILEKRSCLIIVENAKGDTPLHIAARAGHLEIASLLIDYASKWPADVWLALEPLRMTNGKGNTPLHEAVKHRNIEVALKLLGADSPVGHFLNSMKESPLHIAAREGLVSIVSEILQQPWVESEEEIMEPVAGTGSPLHQAVLGGHESIVETLLSKRSDLLEVTDSYGDSALHYAAQKNNAKIVEMLLKEKPSLVYAVNSMNRSPLHTAADYGSTHAIKELLKYCPVAMEQVDSEGMNALHIAVMSGRFSALKCLLKTMAFDEIINQGDKDGNTPLHLAAKHSRIQSSILLMKDKRVDPSIKNNDGLTARNLVESLEKLDTYELYIWKKLKKHEAKAHKKQRNGTVSMSHPLRKKMSKADEHYKLSIETYTLVAALIATVTFAATFTIPGGFHQTYGFAILGNQAAFKVFVISNTIAMCSSIVVVFCFIWAWKDPVRFKLNQLAWGHRLTVVACLAMIVTLMSAVYLVVPQETLWLAIVVMFIGCSAPMLVLAILGKDVLFIPL